MKSMIFGIISAFLALTPACAQSVNTDIHSRKALAPPRECEIRMATWCIFRSNITIQHKPSHDIGYRSVWTMWGSYWSSQPSVILEPAGCREGLADMLQVVNFDGTFERDNRKWNSIIVRLKSDKTCDLRLLAPTLKDDLGGAAFSANLSLVGACKTQDCSGPTIGDGIWPAIKRE